MTPREQQLVEALKEIEKVLNIQGIESIPAVRLALEIVYTALDAAAAESNSPNAHVHAVNTMSEPVQNPAGNEHESNSPVIPESSPEQSPSSGEREAFTSWLRSYVSSPDRHPAPLQEGFAWSAWQARAALSNQAKEQPPKRVDGIAACLIALLPKFYDKPTEGQILRCPRCHVATRFEHGVWREYPETHLVGWEPCASAVAEPQEQSDCPECPNYRCYERVKCGGCGRWLEPIERPQEQSEGEA